MKLCAIAVAIGCGSESPPPIPSVGSGSSGSANPLGSAVPAKPSTPKLEAAPIEPDPRGLFTLELQLGTEPAIPPAFGALRPWLRTSEIAAARPKDWGDKHWHKNGEPDKGGIRWGYARISPDKYDRITELNVMMKRRDTRRRLIEAWGEPFTHEPSGTYSDDVACWVAKAAKLRACHKHAPFASGGTDQILFLGMQPLDDALAAGMPTAPEKLSSYLGKTRDQIRALFPDAIEDRFLSKTNPELIHPMLATEYRNSWLPDDLTFGFLDDKVFRVILAFHCDDKARIQELRERLVAPTKRAEGPAHETRNGGGSDFVTIVVVAK
jgi:hypothetical protein